MHSLGTRHAWGYAWSHIGLKSSSCLSSRKSGLCISYVTSWVLNGLNLPGIYCNSGLSFGCDLRAAHPTGRCHYDD